VCGSAIGIYRYDLASDIYRYDSPSGFYLYYLDRRIYPMSHLFVPV
jgi:hypothetical protein